jgi:surface antigen
MAVPAWQSTENYSAYDTFDTGLVLGDRIGPPRSSYRKVIFRSSLVFFLAAGAAAPFLGTYVGADLKWRDWLATAKSVASSVMERTAPQPVQPEINAPPVAQDLAAPLPSTEVAAAPGPAPDPVEAQTVAVAQTATSYAAPTEAAATSPLPPPTPGPLDAYQKRAAAAGLHTDLSHVLLAQLSNTDYRNAGIAIKTALAETPDDAVHTWPLKPKPDLAVFEVHFVPGAAADCRRYVVTVTKGGWLTTALPVEKCGLKPVKSKVG